jgi:hypothetical protein
MSIRFVVANGHSRLRLSESQAVDAWYASGRIYFLDCKGLGYDLEVKSLLVKYLDVSIDGCSISDVLSVSMLNSYGFSQTYKRYAFELSIAFHNSAKGTYDGQGDELFADTVHEYRNYLFVSSTGYHHVRCGKKRSLATYIDGFVFMYEFSPDGTLASDRKQLSLFTVVNEKTGTVYEECEYDYVLSSFDATEDSFRWSLELLDNYYGNKGMNSIAVLSPLSVILDTPVLYVKDGRLLFKEYVHDYFKECCVVNGVVHDGYGRTSLKKPFCFFVTPDTGFINWYRTLSRVLLGSYNPSHLDVLTRY